ncbi:unnamed protein product [Allacma fusca]|uniref:Uncharacterized protein n=1 Tax=Allacma fusca TaxID=39272 RepID=A0A8J2J965_9HEXA|nr:unnamed protein product [Allacma fusca]
MLLGIFNQPDCACCKLLLFCLFTWTLLGITRADIEAITEDRTHFKKDLLNWEPPEDLKKIVVLSFRLRL